MKFKLIYTDGIYVGVLNGSPFISDSLTTEQVKILTNNPTEEQVIEIFNPKIAEVAQHNREVKEIQDILVGSELFELKQGSYFRVGIPYSVPKLLLDKYKEKIVNGLSTEALDNFWTKCCLNPNSQTRDNLFTFLDKWGFEVTNRGYIVGYRNVDVVKTENQELHNFIATNYVKIKGQKKSPKNYNVYQTDEGEYICHHNTVNTYLVAIGDLQSLYNNLSDLSETIYTDHYTKRMKIQIGEVVSIPRKDCDESQTECSAGLHIGGTSWLNKDYFGQEGLVCLVNPMDVVSCPNAAVYGKMRTCSYLPIGVAEYDDMGKIIPVSTGEYEDDYDVYSTEQLNEILQNIDPSNQVIYKLEMKEISPAVFSSIDEYANQLEFKNEYCGYYDEEE